jgi:hypothetical protein
MCQCHYYHTNCTENKALDFNCLNLHHSTLKLFTPAPQKNMFKKEDEKVDGNSTVTDDLNQLQVINVNSQSHLNMILKG